MRTAGECRPATGRQRIRSSRRKCRRCSIRRTGTSEAFSPPRKRRSPCTAIRWSRKNTSASDFTIEDLVNYERPISLYLVVPPSDKIRLRPLIRLMFTMVVNRLTERMVFEGAEQKRNRHRLLLLIDEFPALNRMEIFADALSYMAGYGLKAYLITQDIRQIVDAYGQNESIVSNCHVRIAFAPNQVETAELLSKMTGTQTVQKASYNFSGSRFSPVMGHMNASVDHIERPLMTPDEVLRLKPPQKQSDGASEKIVAPGQMLIFVSGHYPILGTQMLYFLDPELTRRAAIEPPKDIRRARGRSSDPAAAIQSHAQHDQQARTSSAHSGGTNYSCRAQFRRGTWARERSINHHHANEQSRSSRVSYQKAGNPLSSVRDSGSQCPSGPELPLPGRQQTMAGAHKLAQPVVLRGSVGRGPRIREGREPLRRGHH